MSLLSRFKGLLRINRLERELDDELRSHIEMRTQDNLASGMSPDEARYDARRRFGNSTLMKEDTRAMDIMSACALAAAINASAAELGRQLEGKPFAGLHHPGTDRQVFLAEAQTQRGAYIFLTVFDQDSSLGLVRMYFDEFRANLANAAPPTVAAPDVMLGENFERELNRNLAMLFGRA